MDANQLRLIPFSAERFPESLSLLEKGVQVGVASGMVAGLWEKKRPDQIHVGAFGTPRIGSNISVDFETVFDLASVSKVMATAVLVARFVERGWVQWDTEIEVFFPEFRGSGIRIEHLLSHTAGFPAFLPFWESLRKKWEPKPLYQIPIRLRQLEMRRHVLSVRPETKPGERVLYSDISFLLLAFILEDLSGGIAFCDLVRDWIWAPMGLSGASFRPITAAVEKAQDPKIAATEDCPWRNGILQGQVHDDNCWAMGGYAGHAGAFGRVRDVLHFSRALMFGRFLSAPILQKMWARMEIPHGCDHGYSRTMGWDTPSGELPSAGAHFSRNSVGHLGFTGTSLWIDLDAELAVVLLTNRVHPTRENIKIRAFRPMFHDAIRSDLVRQFVRTT